MDVALKQILTERKPCDIDHRIVLPHGADFAVHLQAEAVFDDQLQALTIIVSPRTDARTDQIRRSDIAISLSRVISGVESRTS